MFRYKDNKKKSRNVNKGSGVSLCSSSQQRQQQNDQKEINNKNISQKVDK